jgi:sugar phosphate isomerase/epimerase
MTRRRFALTAAAAPAASMMAAPPPAADDLKLGVASYSLRNLSRARAIEVVRQLRTPYINIKEFHLPYKSTPEEIAAARKDFADAGLTVLGGGNIALRESTEEGLRVWFDYARAAGFPLIVCAPTPSNVGLVEKLVKEYNIKAAIHNHGPEDKMFPTPQSVLQAIKGMDPRMGLCIDIGHTARTGVDVVESIREAGPRLLDLHIKDLTDFSSARSQVAVGDGVMPIAAIFRELKRMNFQGGVMLEYEIEADNPAPGMIKSFAYMRGVLAGLRG